MAPIKNAQVLAGRRILVVEDEMLLAMDIEMLLEKQGCEVLGPVGNVERALQLLETVRPDAVTLDMNLNGDSSAPIAAVLRERDIPFVAVTGYTDSHGSDPAFQGVDMVKKPYASTDLIRAIGTLLE